MSKPAELREQNDEQLGLLLAETQQNLFRLRLQSETERLEAPSEIVKAKREIARLKTGSCLRELDRGRTGAPQPTRTAPPPGPDRPPGRAAEPTALRPPPRPPSAAGPPPAQDREPSGRLRLDTPY